MKIYWTVLGLGLAAAAAHGQDHGHLNVGSSGHKLTWNNGADFAPGTGYVKTLVFTNGAKWANFYQGNITLTAMHSRDPFGEVDPAAPRNGAFIVAEIVSVEGPSGGAFAFWENTSTPGNPTASIPAGTTNAAVRFALSQAELGAGEPEGDAYGHIHGRRFTATLPGIYTVGFRAHDTSTNGESGGPIHEPTGIQFVQFQAGVVLTKLEPGPGGARVRLGAQAGYSWQVQGADDLRNPEWEEVGSAVPGNDLLVEVEFGGADAPERYFRAVGTPVAP
jgi:hypothetical protein